MLTREKTFRASTARAIKIVFSLAALLLLTALVKAQSPTPTPTPTPTSEEGPIHVRVSVMAPQIVSDTFGKRVAENFIAIQVTVANHDKDYQYLINDVSLYLNDVFTPAPSKFNFFLSSAELSLLRGVAEKGQGQDKRNLTLRFFRGVGTIAAGLIGVTSFGPSYPKSVAVFNGPVINAFSEAFPDYTINQMNRLSDSAYQANTLVPAKHSKVIVAFIPQAIFLNKEQRKQFWKDPAALYPDASGSCHTTMCVDFRRVVAYIDGDHITEVSNVPPVVSTAQFIDSELQKFENDKPVVKGYVVGRFLTGTSISLLNQDPKGLSIVLDGTPTADRINFIIKSDKPVPPGTKLNFEVASAQGVEKYTKEVSYMPDPPTLTAISPSSGKQNTSVTASLIGTNFIPGAGNTRVTVSGNGVEVSEPVDVVGNSLRVTFNIDKNAAIGPRNVTVVNANSESAPITFTITAAAGNP